MCNANIHHICLSHVASVMTYVNTEGGDAHKCATPTFFCSWSRCPLWFFLPETSISCESIADFCLFVCLFVYLHVRLCVCLHVCEPVGLNVCLSVCLSVCLYVSVWKTASISQDNCYIGLGLKRQEGGGRRSARR